MKIALFGFGRMGQVAAKALIGEFDIVICDVDGSARREARSLGAQTVEHASELDADVKVILLFLPGPQDVRGVVGGNGGILSHLARGATIVDLSTVDPETSQTNAKLAEGAGIGYLDAPVLGRPSVCGRWTLPVGGDPRVLELVRPVLGRLAKRIVHVGPSGSGNVIKLLNNMMFAAINVITAEVMGICAKTGVAQETLFRVLGESDAATVSGLFRELGSKMVAREFSPVFTVDLLHKDLSLGVQMAREHGIPPLASTVNLWLIEMAQAHQLGKLDSASLVRLYDDLFPRETNGYQGA